MPYEYSYFIFLEIFIIYLTSKVVQNDLIYFGKAI